MSGYGYIAHGVGALDPDSNIGNYCCAECRESVYFVECSGCGDWIQYGDDYYKIGNKSYCEVCVTYAVAGD